MVHTSFTSEVQVTLICVKNIVFISIQGKECSPTIKRNPGSIWQRKNKPKWQLISVWQVYGHKFWLQGWSCWRSYQQLSAWEVSCCPTAEWGTEFSFLLPGEWAAKIQSVITNKVCISFGSGKLPSKDYSDIITISTTAHCEWWLPVALSYNTLSLVTIHHLWIPSFLRSSTTPFNHQSLDLPILLLLLSLKSLILLGFLLLPVLCKCPARLNVTVIVMIISSDR